MPTLWEKNWQWSLSGWRGIALPLGTPKERADLLLKALRKVVTGDEYRDFLKKAGFGARAGEPAQFTATLKESDENFGDIFKSEAFASVQTQQFGPMVLPIILASLFVLTVIGLSLTGQWKSTEQVAAISRTGWIRIVALLTSLVAYVLVAEWLGFLITASILLFLLLWLFGVRLVPRLVVTICLVAVVYELFAVVLRVPLPWGMFGW